MIISLLIFIKLFFTHLPSILQASITESEDDSLTRTALEDTLMDGDPLQHTILSDDVLRSPQTMRALEKFRAGARKERFDGEGCFFIS